MFKFGKFISQTTAEMKKVTWPNKDELIASTIVVLVSTFFLAVFIGFADVVISRVINVLISGVL